MDTLLGERLNSEPVVFRGYTDSELMLVIGVAGAFWFPTGFVSGFLMGSIAIGLGFAMFAVLGSIVGGATLYQKWKRGRPDYYLQQRVHIGWIEAGLTRSRLIRRRGVMSLGRDYH